MSDKITQPTTQRGELTVMTPKSAFITAAMLITFSLSAASAAVILPGSITVTELAKETLARKALREVEASAAVIANAADQSRMMADPKASPESHFTELAALKSEVNRMGQEIRSLQAEGESLAPQEQRAVDKVLPLFRTVAANTENAIDYFNESRDHLWTEDYRSYADCVSRGSEQIAQILKNYVKYDKLREQEIQAEEHIWANSVE
jgi:hypothetical protein